MNLYGCISTKPAYNFGYWPSVFYLTQPGAGKYLCEVCGLGMPGAEVTLRIDSRIVGTTHVRENGKWCFPAERLPILKKGGHSIKVVHYDGYVKDTAYSYITITDDPGDESSRTIWCETKNNPVNNLFHFTYPGDRLDICIQKSEVDSWAFGGENATAGRYVLLRLFQQWSPVPVYQATVQADPDGNWEFNITNSKPLIDTLAALPAGVFCMSAKDLDTGRTDDVCFCTESQP
ncbi:MAG: hypothetical protein LBH66_02545 [Oscillospiraceae bacterium]|jgi:hypothetical protein|nr:hypothetical protein [Oscillospiraceae bacterium]